MPDGRKPPKVKIIPGDSPFQRLGAGGKTYDRSHLKVFDKFDPHARRVGQRPPSTIVWGRSGTARADRRRASRIRVHEYNFKTDSLTLISTGQPSLALASDFPDYRASRCCRPALIRRSMRRWMPFARSAAAIERCLDSGSRRLLSHSTKLPSVALIT